MTRPAKMTAEGRAAVAKAKSAKAPAAPTLAPCALCGKATDAKEGHCYGCKAVICDGCDVNMTLMGGHKPEAHVKCRDCGAKLEPGLDGCAACAGAED